MDLARTKVELLSRWLDGGSAAAALQLARCDDALSKFFRHKARTQDCEDLRQEVWSRLFASPPEVFHHSPRAYVLGIARHVLYRYYKERRGESWDPLTSSMCDLDPRLAVQVRYEEGDWAPLAVLQQLALDEQVLLEMRYEHDLPLAEIAVVLEVPLGTVKSRLSTARRRFKAILCKGGRR